MAMKQHDPCPRCIQLLVASYPQAITLETVDDVIQIRFGFETNSNAVGTQHLRQRVVWTPLMRAIDYGNFQVILIIILFFILFYFY